jgi:hypothetical protein
MRKPKQNEKKKEDIFMGTNKRCSEKMVIKK